MKIISNLWRNVMAKILFSNILMASNGNKCQYVA